MPERFLQMVRFLKGLWARFDRRNLKEAVRASESPVGFAFLASLGLVTVLLLNLGSSDGDVPPADDIVAEDPLTDESAEVANAEDPDVAQEESGPAAEETAASESRAHFETIKLRRGETLIELLRRAGIHSRNAHLAVTELGKVVNLRRLQAGQVFELRRAANSGDTLAELVLRQSFDTEARVTLEDQVYRAEARTIPTIALTRLVEGRIDDNLYMAAKAEGMRDKTIIELIRLLSFDVDFERDIREGDEFQVYYERSYAPDYDEFDEGRILHARLKLRRSELEANYFASADGDSDYYDGAGKSVRKALMRTPLDVAILTSAYGKRKHPVLGYTRMHKGVDFRARTGTPIMAAGDGVIERASRYGSYGNYIRIRHNSTYSTAYAHLSKYGKGIRAGARVKQGQIIGYAGATGRVSAAHLHYEVLVNGEQTNPMRIKMPEGRELAGQDLAAFGARRDRLLADINEIQAQNRILLAVKDGGAPEGDRVTLDEAAVTGRIALTP